MTAPLTALPPRAGLWRRVSAMVYDGFLLTALLFVGSWLFLKLFGDATQGPLRYVYQLFLLGLCACYLVYCWSHNGQTLAMKTWGLRVVRDDSSPLTLGNALLRFVLALGSLALAGCGFLWALVDSDRQFLHDRLGGTRIVRAPI